MSTHEKKRKPQQKRSNSMTNKKSKWLSTQLNTPTKRNQKIKRSRSSVRVNNNNSNNKSRSPFHYKPFKPGPRDIGRIENTDWTPIKYNENTTHKKKSKKSLKKSNVYKPGPRDIGRVKESPQWKPIQLTKEEEMKLNSGFFLEERIVKRKNKKSKQKIYKPGPRDIGRNDNWNPIPLKTIQSKRIRITLNKNKNKNKKSKQIIIPDLRIICSPKTNEAIFIGYKNINTDSENNTDENKQDVSNDKENEMIENIKPQTAKFTFLDIKKRYKPNHIKWTSENDNNSNSLCDSPILMEESEDDDSDSGHSNIENDNGKCTKIDDLLSDLLNCDNDTKQKSYTIVIDDIKQNDNGDDVYSGCLMTDENNDEDDQELLFDFQSFVNHLKKNTNDNSDD